ncbi:MAG: endolytic transglycosylase MltG [Anaerolineales bacterium]
MKTKSRNPFGCLVALGVLSIAAFVTFFMVNGLMASAEAAFGPPAPNLSAFQRVRLGVTLGLRAAELQQPAVVSAAPVRFDIGLNEPASQISARLWTADLVREGNLFSNYLIYTGLDTQLQAGSYQLSAAMSAVELAQALLDPTPESVTLVILPGWRLEEIAATLPSAGVAFTPEEFLLAAWSPPSSLDLPAGFPANASLEGYLLPGSYEIGRQQGVGAALNLILTEGFHQQVDSVLRQAFANQGLSEQQALIIASIVERESVFADEQPLIASVFLNRFHNGIKLEADPTVQYALGYDPASSSWWKSPLTRADLSIQSPHNTYLNGSLPPSPIAAPSLEALTAVAFPQTSPYFFFQAFCDGSGRHVFSVTYEEHIANNCQ